MSVLHRVYSDLERTKRLFAAAESSEVAIRWGSATTITRDSGTWRMKEERDRGSDALLPQPGARTPVSWTTGSRLIHGSPVMRMTALNAWRLLSSIGAEGH